MKTNFNPSSTCVSAYMSARNFARNSANNFRRIAVLLVLLLSFAFGAKAADYVFTYTYGDNTYFLGQTTTPTTSFVPNASIYTGNSGSTFRNANGYYIRYDDGLDFSTTTGTNLTITNNNIAYVEEGWWGDTYYLNMRNPNNNSRTWRMSNTQYYRATAYTVTTSSHINTFTISGDATIKTVGTYNYTHTNATYYDSISFNNKTYYSTNASQAATTTVPTNNLPTIDEGYTWTISSNSYATVNASTGAITVNNLPATETEVTLTCSVSINGVTKTAKKTITLQMSGNTPTSISASDFSLAVGTDDDISYTLTGTAPIYDKVEATSSNTGIFTVVTSPTSGGKVTLHPVAMGSATLTLIAKAKDGTTNACSTTVKITVAERVKTPTIEYESNGAKALTTITCATEGATIYYTIDGSDPTTSSNRYDNPFEVDEKVTVKAMAVKTGYINSSVASRKYETFRPTGIDGGVVTLNDLEDHNWSYYQAASNRPDGYPVDYLSSPDPRNVKITYQGGEVSGASAVAISVLDGEGQNTMVYYKTLEKSVPGMTGDYPYTVISNPFSKRPRTIGSTGTNGFYGFAGWKVVSGGEYISEYNDGQTLPLDATIHFTNLDNNYTPNCTSGEVVFEATWTPATVKTGSGAQSFDGGTYETNFWVLSGSNNIGNITVPNNCTVSSRYPDGTVNFTRNLTGSITAGGNNAKVEFVNMNSTGNVSAANYTFTMGRGIVNSGNGGELRGCTRDADCEQTVKVESGKYGSLRNFTTSLNSSRSCDQLMILGCDYDRARATEDPSFNSKLEITGSMYVAGTSLDLRRNSGDLYVRGIVKSGNFLSSVSIDDDYTGAGGTQTYYFSVGNSNTQNAGRRYLLVEGGILKGIAGGMDEDVSQSTTNRSFDLRVRGTAQIDGVVYGAAEYAGARGARTMVFTGGLVKGWIAAGANGTQPDGGLLSGATYLYFGGNARTDSGNSKQVMNRSVGGNVFGAGCGYGATSSSGQITLGTNVVIADDAYVERGVYGGGSYGFTTATSNIYILGGTVDGKSGGTNGTNFREEIDGGVYGGACQNQGGTANVIMNDGIINGCVYGGSNYTGTLSGTSTVTLNGGTINGSLYGGGNGEGSANTNIDGAVQVNVYGGTVTDAVYGCNNNAGAPQSTVKVDIYGTDPAPAEGQYALHSVYGGGNKAPYNGTPIVTVHNCDNSIEYVYGGGNAASVNSTNVTIWGGNKIGNVFGGGNGESGIAADVNGNAVTKIYGGTILNVYGGSNALGKITGEINVTVDSQGEGGNAPCLMNIGDVYGGGNRAASNVGNLNIVCTGTDGYINRVFGGANAAEITGDIELAINGGNIGSVFGGNNSEQSIEGNVTVNIGTAPNACGIFEIGNVHGGGYGKATGVTGNVEVNIAGGTINGDVYGGSALGKVNTNTSNTTVVNLTGGVIHGDAYGGGLGDSYTKADVNGNVTVTLNGTAFVLATTTDDKGNSIPTSGRIFGCNNINGSPKGTVLVKVLKTVAKNSDGTTKDKPTKGDGIYELQAVYGGGNLAAYNPSDPFADGQYIYGGNPALHENTDKPVQVVIDGCNLTSIEYVYGGGNAAATPATDVIILGSYEIGNVFGGGNGKDRYTLDGGTTWNENHGADVGIIDAVEYANNHANGLYGTGKSKASVLGGTVHNLFGASNTKGNVVTESLAYVDDADICTLDVGDIYGGGNEAYMDGDSKIVLGCIEALEEIYGGARNADVKGDINLTISSGHFDRVFGGNNIGGTINGSITVTIEETGCNPITIGELYGCGNQAAYTTPAGKEHPTINLKSFTSIGNVYGGGLGKDAVVTGNPTVNINVSEGTNSQDDWSYNGTTINFEDGSSVTLPSHDEGKIGAIGNVFGGGNAAAVIGDTQVNIGTEASKSADIRGNVYGGGNQAKVTGQTNVVIGG